MSKHLFNEDMTSIEAQHMYFAEIDALDADQRKRVKEDFDKTMSIILRREVELARQGWLS